MYGIPYEFYAKKKLRKYGFHGTSHYYVAKKAALKLGRDLSNLRIISLHLGNGCSACAINNGKSVDTSMGFTPLSGLFMGTRCGDLDPSVLFQMASNNSNFMELENILNKKSGMLGICGLSDMREVLENSREEQNKLSSLAIDMFCYSAKKFIGSYFTILGGVDAIIFTAGIGEHSAEIRERIVDGLGCIGMVLDKSFNSQTTNPTEAVEINAPQSQVKILVIPTDEEKEIARQAAELVTSTKK